MKKVKNMITEQITLTNEELAQLQSLVTTFNTLQSKCGEVEIQKHQLLHKIEGVIQALDSLQAELKETYGTVSIDINTGVCIPQSDEISS